jgi:hypothetical protein
MLLTETIERSTRHTSLRQVLPRNRSPAGDD